MTHRAYCVGSSACIHGLLTCARLSFFLLLLRLPLFLPFFPFSYWTDNGVSSTNLSRTRVRTHTNRPPHPTHPVSQAYYYYLTEPAKTMQQTVLDVLAYLNTLALPVRHLMYDSWWRVLAS